MPIENEDLQLFQIIYAQNPGQPISFIQEEVLKAKLALLQNAEKLQNAAEREKNADGEKRGAKGYKELKKSDLRIKSRAEIDAAIGEDKITCCICRAQFSSLGAHLKRVHHVSPKDYIRVCGYPAGTKLMSKNYLVKARANAKHAQQNLPRNRFAGPETVIGDPNSEK